MWFVFTLLSTIFAALTSILAKIGIEGVKSNLYKEYLISNDIKEDNIIMLALDTLQYAKYRNPIELGNIYEKKILDNKST